MQRVLNKFDFSHEAVSLSVIWALFTLGIPTKTGNYDFRQMLPNDGFVLSVSRSAPPMAILEDEKLKSIPIEPVKEIKLTKGSRLISAGNGNVWPKLQYYNRLFRKKQRLARAKALAQSLVKAPTKKSINSILSLVRLAAPEADTTVTPIQVYAVDFAADNNKPMAPRGKILEQTIRDHIEVPVITPVTQKSLARHVEAAQKVEDKAPAMVAVAVTPIIDEKPKSKSETGLPAPVQPKVTIASSKTPEKIAPTLDEHLASITSKTGYADTKVTAVEQAPQSDIYKIQGQVELTGGLVATGTSTKIDIQWVSGSVTRQGTVDYSGFYSIDVPSAGGEVMARLLDDSGATLGVGEVSVDPAFFKDTQTAANINVSIESSEPEIRGTILSAYSVDKAFVPLLNPEIFGPAMTHAEIEKRGSFRIPGLSSNSTFVVEGFAPNHWGTRVLSSAKRNVTFPIFPQSFMDSFLNLIGHDAGNPDYGVIWGEVKKKGKGVAGVKLHLASQTNIEPIYFNELRIPDSARSTTSDNGLFAFAKVPVGMHVVTSEFSGREAPPTILNVAASRVSYSQIQFQTLELTGNVIDPVLNQVIGAEVLGLGTLETTRSNEDGFALKFPSSDAVVFVEARAPSYVTTRMAITRPEAKNLSLEMYKEAWIKERLKGTDVNYTSKDNLVLGTVLGADYRVSLDDRLDPRLSVAQGQPKIFYCAPNGEIDLNQGEGRAGSAFFVTNLQPGFHTLVIQSASGDVTASRVFVSDPGVINRIVTKL